MPNNGPMVIKLYDRKEDRWHEFAYKNCNTMFVGNGGLMCVVSTAQEKEMEIIVFSLLTRQAREFPSMSSLGRVPPRMVQLVMDQDSKCYKVLVVGLEEEGGGYVVARIFSSLIGEWSKPNIFPDLIFDSLYVGNDGRGHGEKPDPWAYDCARSALVYLGDDYPCRLFDECILVKDCLFVMREVWYWNRKYILMGYQAQSC